MDMYQLEAVAESLFRIDSEDRSQSVMDGYMAAQADGKSVEDHLRSLTRGSSSAPAPKKPKVLTGSEITARVNSLFG